MSTPPPPAWGPTPPTGSAPPFLRRIPGFRSGTPWKGVVASVGYGFGVLVVISAIAQAAGGGGTKTPSSGAVATTQTTTVTQTVTATPPPTPTPSAAPTAQPTTTPAPVPTPTPTAAPCPKGFHNGTPGDTYSGCYPDPTPTPVPVAQPVYRVIEAISGQVDLVCYVEADGPNAALAGIALDLQDGTVTGTSAMHVYPATRLASNAHLYGTATMAGVPIKVYDDGSALGRAACQSFLTGIGG